MAVCCKEDGTGAAGRIEDPERQNFPEGPVFPRRLQCPTDHVIDKGVRGDHDTAGKNRVVRVHNDCLVGSGPADCAGKVLVEEIGNVVHGQSGTIIAPVRGHQVIENACENICIDYNVNTGIRKMPKGRRIA